MHQGMGKASSSSSSSSSSSRRRSSDGYPYDDRPRLAHPSSDRLNAQTASAPSSFFDDSIPLNLPPRRSMKMLKDGSDFVWPDAAHSLFVRGLQAWKVMNIGNKRSRAPRGEGKTDFLVRYLQTNGVERTKKQVASHLQVLRTEWRNSENALLLSLVDDTAPHTRSLSEPSPAPSSNSSPTTSLSMFNISSDPGDDRAISMPSLLPTIVPLPPPNSSSLFHPAHDIYGARSHSHPEPMPDNTFRPQQGSNIGSWQVDNPVWHTAVDRFPSQQSEPYSRSQVHYPVASYDPSQSSFNDYDRTTPMPMVPSPLESRGFSSDYYGTPALPGRGEPSSSATAFPRGTHSVTSMPLETGSRSTMVPISPTLPYDPYNTSASYPSPQHAPPAGYGTASISFGNEPYQPHFTVPQHASPPHVAGISGSTSYDVVEPDFPDVQSVQPQWLRPPATYQRPTPDTPERHDRSPEP